MNIYRYNFSATCPNNGQTINYALKIKSRHVIMAEDIIAAGVEARGLPKPYHENIADALHSRLGGVQRIRAFHHGVFIETWRGS